MFIPQPPVIAKERIIPAPSLEMTVKELTETLSEKGIDTNPHALVDKRTDGVEKEAHIMKIVTEQESLVNEKGDCKTDAMDIVISNATVSIRYGIIGLGQAGGKIADAFADCNIPGKLKQKYPAFAVNTSKADLDALNVIHQHHRIELPNSHLGAMRQPEVGYKAIMQGGAMDRVLKVCDEIFVNVDQVIVAAGIGGGTGTGTIQAVCEALIEKGYSVIPLITLPRDLDSLEEKKNAVNFLNMFQELIVSSMIAAPIIVDNNLLYNHYMKNAPWDTDWKKDSNLQIVKAINEMNAASGIASPTTLDGAELLKLQRSGGCSTIGKVVIPVDLNSDFNNEEILETLKDELNDAMHNGLLCDYPQLNEARAAGVQVLLPRTMSFGVAMEQAIDTVITESMPTLISKFVGYVPVDDLEEIRVYTLISGLGLPERASNLSKAVTKEVEYLTQADSQRTLFQANDVVIRNPFSKKGKKQVSNPFSKIEAR